MDSSLKKMVARISANLILLLFLCTVSVLHVVLASRPNCATPLNTKGSNTADSFGRQTLINDFEDHHIHIQQTKSHLGGKSVKVLSSLSTNFGFISNFIAKISFNSLPPTTFNGVLGPTNANIPQVAFTSTANVKCYACQVACEKAWAGLSNTPVFERCPHKYFYYGCDRPCYSTSSASEQDIAQMIAICRVRNKCAFNHKIIKKYRKGSNKNIIPNVIKGIRSVNESTRE